MPTFGEFDGGTLAPWLGPRGFLSVDRDGIVLSDAVPCFAVLDFTATDLKGCEEPRGF